ncbi:MAG TPA: hypothetical protein VH985_21320, partial [Candidatus Binatia bacterium]
MIVFGGGHTDYDGNEVYALDINSLTISRLTNPGLPLADGTCKLTAIAGGTQPNSRHTYNGLAYIAHTDQMFVVAGSLASACGATATPADMWLFSLSSNTWSRVNPTFSGIKPSDPQYSDFQGYTAVYNPNDRMVYFHDQAHLFRYNPSNNTVTQIGVLNGIGYHTNAVFDPVHNLYVIVGPDNNVTNGVAVYDLTNAAAAGVGTISPQSRSTTGANAI